MKRVFILCGLAVGLVLASCSTSTEEEADALASYEKDLADWHQNRITELKGEDGWLNVAGRYWLAPGKNTVGTHPGNMIVFPVGKGPGHIGYITVADSTVSFTAMPDVAVTDEDNKPFTSGPIFIDTGNFKTLSYKSLKWFVIKRSGRFVLRLRDMESDELKTFTKIDRYQVDESWRIEADFEPAKEGATMNFDNVIGSTSEMPYIGVVSFERDGKKYHLQASQDEEELFIVFSDTTAGKETYHSGRFLKADMPKKGQTKVILDFNKAYNPPCAFTDYATCPLPPKENRLRLAIRAGEKKYGH